MKNRSRGIWAFLFFCVLMAALAFLYVRMPLSFYSTHRIEAILERRYHVPFTVLEEIPGDGIHAPQQDDDQASRLYLVQADPYPELVFQVKDGWTASYGIRGFFGDHYTVPSEHTLWDNCKAVVWNTYATPMLQELGVPEAVIKDREQYGDNGTYSEYPWLLQYSGDPADTAEQIYALAARINALPIFRDIAAETEHYDDPFRQYRFRIALYITLPSPEGGEVQEVFDWLHIYPGYQYTLEEISLKVDVSLAKLKEEYPDWVPGV